MPNRTQFKHVVFGPQLWSPDEEAHFPAIRDLIEAGDWEAAKTYLKKTAGLLRQAANSLNMGGEEGGEKSRVKR
jgi:N-acetylated-alpha-linked acidic dipeptidase